MLLIIMFQVTKDIETPFMCLLEIIRPPLDKCMLNNHQLKNDFLCEALTYVLSIVSTSNIQVLNSSYYSVGFKVIFIFHSLASFLIIQLMHYYNTFPPQWSWHPCQQSAYYKHMRV